MKSRNYLFLLTNSFYFSNFEPINKHIINKPNIKSYEL